MKWSKVNGEYFECYNKWKSKSLCFAVPLIFSSINTFLSDLTHNTVNNNNNTINNNNHNNLNNSIHNSNNNAATNLNNNIANNNLMINSVNNNFNNNFSNNNNNINPINNNLYSFKLISPRAESEFKAANEKDFLNWKSSIEQSIFLCLKSSTSLSSSQRTNILNSPLPINFSPISTPLADIYLVNFNYNQHDNNDIHGSLSGGKKDDHRPHSDHLAEISIRRDQKYHHKDDLRGGDSEFQTTINNNKDLSNSLPQTNKKNISQPSISSAKLYDSYLNNNNHNHNNNINYNCDKDNFTNHQKKGNNSNSNNNDGDNDSTEGLQTTKSQKIKRGRVQTLKWKKKLYRASSKNERCCECNGPSPDWASLNLGIMLCQVCAGIHRSLGAHISKVKSLYLDHWSIPQLSVI
jgi:hypothetical protein